MRDTSRVEGDAHDAIESESIGCFHLSCAVPVQIRPRPDNVSWMASMQMFDGMKQVPGALNEARVSVLNLLRGGGEVSEHHKRRGAL